MATSYTTFQGIISNLVYDPSSLLISSIKNQMIDVAVKQYSRHKPREYVETYTADGTKSYSLSSTNWEVNFSRILKLEFPIDQAPPEYLDEPDDYEILKYSNTVEKVVFYAAITSGSQFRILHTKTHAVDASSSTILTHDEQILGKLAASYCLEYLATYYAQTVQSSINADIVNYRSKSREFLDLAKKLQEEYKKAIESVAGSSLTADWDAAYAWAGKNGGDRLFHSKKWH